MTTTQAVPDQMQQLENRLDQLAKNTDNIPENALVNHKEARNIIRHNCGGWPTNLKHQLIMIYGFDQELINGILAFGEKIKANKGNLILVTKTERYRGPDLRTLMQDQDNLQIDFYLGRIDRELSFSKGIVEERLTLGDAHKFFPVSELGWADSLESKIGPPEKCVTFPSAYLIQALGGKEDRYSSHVQKVKILIGDEEIEAYDQNLGLHQHSRLFGLMLRFKKNEGGDPASS